MCITRSVDVCVQKHHVQSYYLVNIIRIASCLFFQGTHPFGVRTALRECVCVRVVYLFIVYFQHTCTHFLVRAFRFYSMKW